MDNNQGQNQNLQNQDSSPIPQTQNPYIYQNNQEQNQVQDQSVNNYLKQQQYANQTPNYNYSQPQPVIQQSKKQNKRRHKKVAINTILLWIIAGILEMTLIGFAIFGVYVIATGGVYRVYNSPPTSQNGYDYGNNNNGGTINPYIPQIPNIGGSGSTSSQEQEEAVNNSKVQMGIKCYYIDEAYASKYNIETGLGVVSINSDSDAMNRDIKEGDVITHVNGVRIKSLQSFFDEIEFCTVGQEIELTICRQTYDFAGNQAKNVTIKEKLTLQAKQEQSNEPSSEQSSKDDNAYPNS